MRRNIKRKKETGRRNFRDEKRKNKKGIEKNFGVCYNKKENRGARRRCTWFYACRYGLPSRKGEGARARRDCICFRRFSDYDALCRSAKENICSQGACGALRILFANSPLCHSKPADRRAIVVRGRPAGENDRSKARSVTRKAKC